MKLAVISLGKLHFEGDAASVVCRTPAGELTILDHHRPLITELAAGTIKITDANHADTYVAISAGFLEINAENQARLLVDE